MQFLHNTLQASAQILRIVVLADLRDGATSTGMPLHPEDESKEAGTEGGRPDMGYTINMRKAISITLSEDNLLWLRGQAARTARGSVSEVLDQIVGEARTAGRTDPTAVRSVVGTIDLPEDDPDLAGADGYIRTLFAASARQPLLVRERPRPARKGKSVRG